MTARFFLIRLSQTLLPSVIITSLVIMLALWYGTIPVSIENLVAWVMPGQTPSDETVGMVLSQIRWPRILGAASVGSILAIGGLVFQAILGNPLAEPYILGISGGSAIGAILGVVLGVTTAISYGAAFTGGLATLALLYLISRRLSLYRQTGLLLSGVMINAFCGAVILFLVTLTMDWRIHQVLIWIMGDLSAFTIGSAHAITSVTVFGVILIWLNAQTLNLLMMGSDVASSLGASTQKMTWLLLTVVSFMVAAAVSACGLVGFVGLVIPHALRMIVGGDHRILVPVSAITGAGYLVGCDLLSRIIHPESMLPVGVITALIGAPVFIGLLIKEPDRCR